MSHKRHPPIQAIVLDHYFVYPDGRGLTRQHFKAALDNILSDLHMNKAHYNTHSFLIGEATSGKQANIHDTYIRWRSDIYQHYIKTPPLELAKLSKHLTDGYPSHRQ